MSEITVTIYEFSTGINYILADDGQWISTGFTGQYMNITTPEIPLPVQQAISGDLFAVVEGATGDTPAVIARVVGDWSVVAIVSRGKDDQGRPVSVYRYFFCSGSDNLWQIITWMENLQKLTGKLPIFKPTDKRQVHSPINYLLPVTSSVLPPEDFFPIDNTPYLLPPIRDYSLQDIHTMACILSTNQCSFSWAYNVEALVNPQEFLLIHPATQKAYDSIRQTLVSSETFTSLTISDGKAVKSAVTALINNSKIQATVVSTIAFYLQTFDTKTWQEILDSEGASQALRQRIYGEFTTRLLLLRSLLIPTTLPEYLFWLNLKIGQYPYDFLWQDFIDYFPQEARQNLDKNLTQGIMAVIIYYWNKSEIKDSLFWLLSTSNTIWGAYFREGFADLLLEDIPLISQKNYKRSELKVYAFWKPLIQGFSVVEYYQVIAELFASISTQKAQQLSACFYHFCTPKDGVPRHVFYQAFGNKQTVEEFLGLNIHCQPQEFLGFKIHHPTINKPLTKSTKNSFIKFITFAISGGVIVMLGLLLFSLLLNRNQQEIVINKAIADENIQETRKTLIIIRNQLATLPQFANYTHQQIDDYISKAICQDVQEKYCQDITILPKVDQNKVNKVNWALAIMHYQKSRDLQATGYLTEMDLVNIQNDLIYKARHNVEMEENQE